MAIGWLAETGGLARRPRAGCSRWAREHSGSRTNGRIEGIEQCQRRANLGGALHRVECTIACQQVQDRDFREASRCASGRCGDLSTVAGGAHLGGPALDERLDAARSDDCILVTASLLMGQNVLRTLDQLARAIGLFSRPRRCLLHDIASF
jgi:hypothetical protein